MSKADPIMRGYWATGSPTVEQHNIMTLSRILLLIILIWLTTITFIYAEPKGQPDQLISPVQYDAMLSDPFFMSNEWSYPWWVVNHYDGYVETIEGDKIAENDSMHLKHTANCITNQQYEHKIRFCEAELSNGTIILYIHDFTASTNDNLKIKITNRLFQCQYWTAYVADKGDEGLIWTTKKQILILDKREYKKGDTIKGKLEFECLQEVTNPKYKGRYPHYIRIEGVFKTTVN